MTELEFIAELTTVLERHSDSARTLISELLASLPDRATRLDLVIFPSQDADGFFTVAASVDGPDLYVINKAIRGHAELFGPKHTESGVEPPIPIVDSDDVDYSVNDIVVDCAAKWLQTIWQSIGNVQCRIPVVIVGHDDYGTITPINLHSGKSA
ncbi:MAG: DUF6389 family protein [Planctomycetes bacterium]|nr:DUF6389 family protein [Planctomycetota bacterium]